MKKLLLPLFFLLLLLSSCSVTETLNAETGYSGVSETDITIDPFFLSILGDFSSFSSLGSGKAIMDDAILGFATTLNSAKSASEVNILSDGEGKRYVISFDYSSLTSLMKELNDGEGNTLIKAQSNSLSFNLNKDNYLELKSVIPFLSDKNFEVYGPEYSNGMSEDEYYDMITFLLGEESVTALKESLVIINITVPGTITTTENVLKTAKNSAVFSFNVIDFLLLNDPLTFKLSWK